MTAPPDLARMENHLFPALMPPCVRSASLVPARGSPFVVAVWEVMAMLLMVMLMTGMVMR